LRRRLPLANPSPYVEFSRSAMDEAAFPGAVVSRTGCGLLLDVNNAHVSCTNHVHSAQAFIDAPPLYVVGQLHLGGFASDEDAAGSRCLS
jgi:uncharacterized protein (UPF0276 family)